MTSSDYREYENGVADVLSSIVGPDVAVERNVQLAGRSGASRQIDVLVRGRMFAVTNATLIVDCKRWKEVVDVSDVDAFAGMVEDVGAEFGMLVSSSESSANAKGRAKQVRGVRLLTLSVAELAAWRPRGTVDFSVKIPEESFGEAARILRNQGLRVAESGDYPRSSGRMVIEVFRHYGSDSPSGEVQQRQREVIDTALDLAKIQHESVSNGVVINGGTPSHRWLNVVFGCMKLPHKILVATPADIPIQAAGLGSLGFPVELLDVERPPGWPYVGLFE